MQFILFGSSKIKVYYVLYPHPTLLVRKVTFFLSYNQGKILFHSLYYFCFVFFSVSDGTVAAAPGKQKELWQLRERIAEALLKVLVVDI